MKKIALASAMVLALGGCQQQAPDVDKAFVECKSQYVNKLLKFGMSVEDCVKLRVKGYADTDAPSIPKTRIPDIHEDDLSSSSMLPTLLQTLIRPLSQKMKKLQSKS